MNIVPVDLAVVAKQPVILYDGIVYQHEEENGWKTLDYAEEIKQIFSDEEYLCVLDVIGKLHCDKLPDPYDFGMSGAIYDIAEQALSINEEQKFITANGHVLSDFKALLSDGSKIIYENIDKFENIVMEEKVAMLSGNYILTVSGNVYSLSLNDATVPFVPELEDSFKAWKDIIGIEAYFSSVYGVDKEGKVFVIDFS